jgi:predicted metal-dependent enzyme (double-stranded beta helix superfamily)
MTVRTYGLADFVADLRAIRDARVDDREVIARVRPLVRELALGREWLRPQHYGCNQEQGFGVHALHEEPDHSLWVIAVAWLPGRGAPPHNHGTWAVVGGVDGPEMNVFWRRLDDGTRPGYADLREQGRRIFDAGDVVSFLPDQIHSVVNETDRVTVSLHVYGRHLNHVQRYQFDPAARTASAFTLVVE